LLLIETFTSSIQARQRGDSRFRRTVYRGAILVLHRENTQSLFFLRRPAERHHERLAAPGLIPQRSQQDRIHFLGLVLAAGPHRANRLSGVKVAMACNCRRSRAFLTHSAARADKFISAAAPITIPAVISHTRLVRLRKAETPASDVGKLFLAVSSKPAMLKVCAAC